MGEGGWGGGEGRGGHIHTVRIFCNICPTIPYLLARIEIPKAAKLTR